MLYPKNIKEKLGFDQVIELATQYCETEKGKNHFSRVRFSNDPKIISLWLSQTDELKKIIENGQLSVTFDLDFDLFLSKSKVVGFFYEIETIGYIKDLLFGLSKVVDFSNRHKEEYPNLFNLFKDLDVDYSLVEEIDQVIGPDNEVKPSASKGLQKIYSNISKAERAIIKSSQSLFINAKDKGLLAETELGIKNGRVVLPVLSEHKRKVGGVLIDQSGTGKISYIEPLELVNLNNELSELQIKKRHEIIKVLRELTAKIIVYIDDIKRGVQKLAVVDFIRAKARLASEWEAVKPNLANETIAENAVHPILKQRLKLEQKEIVPLSYSLSENQKVIVISGPNAGGKSVALKTVGLLQLMLQNGFLVPCLETSKFKIYEHIFVDIGDNQSIESDLSTYSSHLKAAKHIINFSNEDTLVLMDEIGTGTDPMFGGPIAEAVLEEIHRKNAQGIITTHFSNIKTKADKLKGVVNAAMLFDIENLVPLYKFQLGQPGSSFVYEVAANIGLNKKLIKRAKQLTNTKQYDLDSLLAEVQSQKDQLNKQITEIRVKEESAEFYEKEYKELKRLLEQEKASIINNAKREAQALIKNANKDIEKTIRVIKESKADKRKTQDIRSNLESKLVNSQSSIKNIKEDKPALVVGDRVQIISTSTIGEIVEIKKNKASLQVGSLITKTNINNLEKVGKKTEKAVKKYISAKSYSNKQSGFSTELDIRGMRTYEALDAVDRWIDTAIILGFNKLKLLHGKGNGILKQEVRRHLKPQSAVTNMEYEQVDLGGEGITIIELR